MGFTASFMFQKFKKKKKRKHHSSDYSIYTHTCTHIVT